MGHCRWGYAHTSRGAGSVSVQVRAILAASLLVDVRSAQDNAAGSIPPQFPLTLAGSIGSWLGLTQRPGRRTEQVPRQLSATLCSMSARDAHTACLGGLFGPLEAAVMEEIWQASAVDVRQVTDALVRSGTDVAYSTIKTVMERLAVKGELTRARHGRQYVYTPTRTRAEAESAAAQGLVNDLFSNHGDLAVSHFVAGAERDPAQLDRLRQLLDAIEPGPEGGEPEVVDGRSEPADAHRGESAEEGSRVASGNSAQPGEPGEHETHKPESRPR